jgi:hypothetical protein
MFYLTPSKIYLYGILLFTSGCATIFHGTQQELRVSSTPLGATVFVDNQQVFLTPAVVNVNRHHSHTFLVSKPGYKDDSFVLTSGTSGWVWGNMGGIGDVAAGGARKLSQKSVHVTLVPLAAHDIPTPSPPLTIAPLEAVSDPLPTAPSPNKDIYAPMYNTVSTIDTQLRNAEREFRAGRMSLEEFREIKRVLQGQ